MIDKKIAQGDANLVAKNIGILLLNIRSQQSEELKVVND